MEQDSTTSDTADGTTLFAGDAWFDPIEAGIRDRIRGFIGELLDQELTAALGRGRHERAPDTPNGYRHGTRERQLTGSFRANRAERATRSPCAAPDRPHPGMAQRGAASLHADDAADRGADRRRLPGRHQHAGGSSARWAPCSAARWARTW